MNKTALIVDDSKSARVVLKRMLEAHELDVDTAESAESALEYLNVHRPDVIFMDHLMPGMDGFEAVTAIKKNPDTATIPIMMYTSQKGEVYVGQARALGAVGVLPKRVEPVEVSKVLESLRVIGDEAERRERRDETDETGTSGDYPALEKFDQDLRELIRDLFDQQRAVLRRDLLDSYEAIAARVADEIRAPDSRDEPAPSGDWREQLPGRFVAVVSVLVVLNIIFGSLYWKRERSWQEAQQQNTNLLKALTEQQAIQAEGAIAADQRPNDYARSPDAAFMAAIAAVEWSVNQSGRYAFGELPLGDTRLSMLEGLVRHLIDMGFTGQIVLETHVGNFCMMGSGAAGYEPAPAAVMVERCEQIGFESAAAYDMGLRQSVAFANFANTVQEDTGGTVEIITLSRGNDEPLVPYPVATTGLTAEFWNEIAAQNNRVETSIVPAGL
ncbi:MAG: PleD family two-component system response regulator [Woeseia sp.]